MDEITKRTVKKTILALRKLLEKEDIPAVLKQHGIFPDGRRVPVEKIALLDDAGRSRRERLEAILEREIKLAGNDPEEGIKRYCREVAFTYLNRLIALRCMEVRGLIDECIKTRAEYAGRSLRHNRFRKENPGARFDAEDTDGLKVFLCSIFHEFQDEIKILFDPDDEYSIIMPSMKALRECIHALNEDIPEEAFKIPELIGWVYQYFQTEEKDRVFEEVRTKKKKIQGDDIVPATSLYTERYMVDYLVQNSLGVIWMEMHPDSKLCDKWPYFVKEQSLKPRESKPVKSLTFLDPACGSGHFLLIAFDLFIQLYEEEVCLAEEGKIPRDWVVSKEKIATTIIESNLHGIDIDLRSIQLSWLVLYLRMREHQSSIGVSKMPPEKVNLVAADASLLDTPEFLSWCEEEFKEEPYALNIIKGVANRLRNLPEIGSLARPEEYLKELIKNERERLLAGWEKNNGQLEMFAEFLPPEQRELHFDKVTDEQFWNGVLSRIIKALDEYYHSACESGDTRAQIMIHEASKGFGFLEVCNKRYDVVATNPPYMSNRNMGKVLKSYLSVYYSEGNRDLYSAFLIRCIQLRTFKGITAIICQQSFMFISSFADLRTTILREYFLRTVVHLGTGAFKEIGGVKVNTAMLCLGDKSDNNTFSFFIRMVNEENKEKELLNLLVNEGNKDNSKKYKINQDKFLYIDGHPYCYWVPEQLLTYFNKEKFDSSVLVANRTKTSDNARYVRFWWECLSIGKVNYRWVLYTKGGGYCKWFGNLYFSIDWSVSARDFYRKDPRGRITDEEYWFKEGITYSAIGTAPFNARYLPAQCVYDVGGPAFIFKDESSLYNALGFMNTQLFSYFLKLLNPTTNYQTGDILRIPFLSKDFEVNSDIKLLVKTCVKIKMTLQQSRVVIPDFLISQIKNVSDSHKSILRRYLDFCNFEEHRQCLMSIIESYIEKKILEIYMISEDDEKFLWEGQKLPPSFLPIIKIHCSVPKIEDSSINSKLEKYLQRHKFIRLSSQGLSEIKSRLLALYEAGPGTKIDDVFEEDETETGDDEDKSEAFIGKRIPIPTETFLEELSVKMEIHPISIYWLLKELREKDGVICWPECRRYVEDYFTVMILRLLGFRWPKQVEADEPIPEWADQDGIIPITEHTGEKTLLERVRDRISAEFGEDKISAIEQEFSDILYNADCKDAEIKGKNPPKKKISLGEWLEREFFRRHASQFKKRPIAWHFTSSNGTFQVLIFYHKLTGDILKNLKNRYLSKVHQFYRVLLERARSGETISGSLTVGKLQDIEAELENFTLELDQVINLPYEPVIDDGVRVNIAPLQKVGLLKHPVLATKDVDLAISDRNRWREDDKEQDTVWRI